MKKKIKLLAIATTLYLSYLFTACGDNNSTSATTSSTEATTPTKENTGVIGYWQTTDEQIPSYYHISNDKMEFIAMGIKMSLDLVITDNTLTASLFGEESTIAYELDGNTLKMIEDGETTKLIRITEEDYNAISSSIELDDEIDENEDPGVDGYVVEPGVTMSVTLDDGTVVVYANDGEGTYIKSTTPPSGKTEKTEDSTEETTTKNLSADGVATRPVAFQRNPYLAKLVLPMTLEEVHKMLGAPTRPGDSYDSWKTDDGYSITAYHKNGTVWSVEAIPTSIASWCDLDNDFSCIDKEKTYTYDELAKLAGSAGIVSTIKYVHDEHQYIITWWNTDKKALYVTFDLLTHKSTYISY